MGPNQLKCFWNRYTQRETGPRSVFSPLHGQLPYKPELIPLFQAKKKLSTALEILTSYTWRILREMIQVGNR